MENKGNGMIILLSFHLIYGKMLNGRLKKKKSHNFWRKVRSS